MVLGNETSALQGQQDVPFTAEPVSFFSSASFIFILIMHINNYLNVGLYI